MTETQKEFLEKLVKEPSKVYFDEPMKKHTTIKIGGNAEVLIQICDFKTLENVLKFAKKEDIKTTVLGNGSNVLVLDGGIKGITLKIDTQKLEIRENKIIAGAGNKLIQVAYMAMENELSGMEELSGIPGTIGGAVYMNAGANGREMKDIVTNITYLDEDFNKKQILNEDAEFSYRHSAFSKNNNIILEVELNLEKGDKQKIKEKMEGYAKIRKEKQPLEYPNTGSTFKRGEDFVTAMLIDKCGLKGYRIGGAEVSTKHAGFIINKGNATSQDVISLVTYIQKKVYEEFGKKIELEMQIIGEE